MSARSRAVTTSVVPFTVATGAAITFATLTVFAICTPVATCAVLGVADPFPTMPRFNLALLVLVAAEACVDPQVSA